ncbi:MAG: hypothetical protein RSC68_23650, partial [Acinetobacter sp.]
HLAYKYGEVFKRGDLPFKIEFYSDITASATEALNNQQTRAGTTSIQLGALQQLKELDMDEEANEIFIADRLGFDDAQAKKIATSLAKSKAKESNENPDDEV